VGADALAVRPLQSETGKPLVVRLTADTVVKQGDTVVDPSALAAGKQARFLVRVCRSADRRLVTARVITLAADTPSVDPGAPSSPAPSTEPRTEPPPPTTEVCGQGETDTVLVAVSDGSITVRTTSSEGTKEWSVTVDGDTVIRKSDQNVSLSALKPGDFVHVVLVRCPSAGTVRALRIVFLHAATTSA